MSTLKLTEIRIDGDTQARAKNNQETINEYAQQMQDGAIFPPVVVFNDGKHNWLADGFHRYFATRQNGGLEIEVETHKGTVDDATLFALGAGARRGLSYTKDDLKEMIMRMVKHSVWGSWSTRKMAEHIGCSHMTVSRIRSSLEEAPKEVSYTRAGVEATMDTTAIGKTPRAPKKAEPEAQEEEIEEDNQSAELIDTINKLSEENDRLKDAIAVGQFDASDIEKIDVEETIKDLREQIRLKDIEIDALRESRDIHQQKAAELLKTVNSLKAKIKKMGGE